MNTPNDGPTTCFEPESAGTTHLTLTHSRFAPSDGSECMRDQYDAITIQQHERLRYGAMTRANPSLPHR